MPKAAEFRLSWQTGRGNYELRENRSEQLLPVAPGERGWFVWLDTVPSFTFHGQYGQLTVRKESRPRGQGYWYAYHRVGQKMAKKYLGRTTNLTLAHLEETAALLTGVEVSPPFEPVVQTPSGGRAMRTDTIPVSPISMGVQLDPLLATRLSPPRPRSHLVSRSRLIERLQQSMECALTLISAPAGFGKTTLLTQWLAERSMPVAWLSLEPGDNDPARFLTSLIAALQTHYPDLDMNILALLQAPQSTPLERALVVLTNDLMHRQREDFALVLDDYQVITDQTLHRALAFLLDHLPPQMHLVLATRADPPLPLARLRACGQLNELRATDLRLSTGESETFMQTVMGLDLPLEAMLALERRTEGWVTGLQLAALSLRGREDVSAWLSAFTGSHRFVLDYLSEEVLSRQPAPLLSFLLRTCILERLCGSLCDAVTEQGDSQAMLEALERANLFVVPLDEERRWYRYHHLFAELLQGRLQQRQPELLEQLHQRASLWCEQHAQPIEAVRHALAAREVERAARLIEQGGMMAAAWGQTHLLLAWLNALPDALVRARPFLCACHATALHLNDQVEEAEARLADAERALDVHPSARHTGVVQALVATIRANLARYAGNLARYVALGQQAVDLLAEANGWMRAGPILQVACGYLVSGNVTTSLEQQVQAAVTTGRTSGYTLMHFRSLTTLARMHVLQGRLREAAAAYEEAGQVAPGLQVLQALSPGAAYCFGLSDVLREWNRLDEAERLLTKGMELVNEKHSVFADDLLLGYLTLARLQHARGEDSASLASLDAFLQLAERRHFVPQVKATAGAVRAHMVLLHGHLEEAIHWADESGLSHEDANLPYEYESAYLVLARVRIAQGHEDLAGPHLSNALRLLERLLTDAEAKARMGSALEILLLQALALAARRDRASALATLESALTLARPQGYLRLFVDEGTPMLTLLREGQARGVMPDYIATLLSAFGAQQQMSVTPSVPADSPLLEPLTAREREVLHLLSEGASNREIAHRLVLSTGTVKKYVYNICGKLGVQSRTQALARARTLHLL
jgi:LuxR family maltose regulon positive regulatory protein